MPRYDNAGGATGRARAPSVPEFNRRSRCRRSPRAARETRGARGAARWWRLVVVRIQHAMDHLVRRRAVIAHGEGKDGGGAADPPAGAKRHIELRAMIARGAAVERGGGDAYDGHRLIGYDARDLTPVLPRQCRPFRPVRHFAAWRDRRDAAAPGRLDIQPFVARGRLDAQRAQRGLCRGGDYLGHARLASAGRRAARRHVHGLLRPGGSSAGRGYACLNDETRETRRAP